MAALIIGAPAQAKHKAASSAVSCQQVRDALASGKSPEDVAKDLKTTDARVKACTAPPKHGHHKATKKAS